MFDIDSLPDMYETMIDRPAFIYDSLENLTYSFTKNLTTFCLFFVNQLNYTSEECQLLFNNTVIDINQVRRKTPDFEKAKRHILYIYIFFQSRKKRDLTVGGHVAVR